MQGTERQTKNMTSSCSCPGSLEPLTVKTLLLHVRSSVDLGEVLAGVNDLSVSTLNWVKGEYTQTHFKIGISKISITLPSSPLVRRFMESTLKAYLARLAA